MKEFARIVAFCVFAAMVYGVLHDQVTARVCVEYFTIGHRFIGTTSPTLLGFAWGILATWWFGLLLGVLLALAARIGALPKMELRDLRLPIVKLMLFCATLALVAGIVGYALARIGVVWLLPNMASAVPAEKHAAFLADLWTHDASYLGGAVGALALCGWTIRERMRRFRTVAKR